MSGSISLNDIVNIVPGTLSAGGTALDLNGLLLTNNIRTPMGSIPAFTDPTTVGQYYGLSSVEYALAQVYFTGIDNSNVKPGQLFIAQYNEAPVAAYLRGAPVSSLTLAQLQAIDGTVTVQIDGSAVTGTANLSTVTSFSGAAGVISTALSGANVTYDAIAGAFVITSGTTGVSSSLAYATGTAAAALGLTAQAGAVLSLGAAAATPATFMPYVLTLVTNWAQFTTAFEPTDADKTNFAIWNNAQGNRFLYIPWDSNNAPAVGAAPSSFGYEAIKVNNYSGVAPVYADINTAMLLLSYPACLDFNQTEGRTNVAFRTQTGMTPIVTSTAVKNNLIANGYNLFGRFATANDTFNFLFDGHVGGQFLWIDSYVNQIWMNNQFQLALITLLTQVNSIPYNTEGYTMIETACLNVIRAAINFGAIRTGITLSALQAAQVNSDAGAQVDGIITQQGWYMYVKDAQPQTRAARQTPPIKFWYTDGQSVQQLTMPSIEIQ